MPEQRYVITCGECRHFRKFTLSPNEFAGDIISDNTLFDISHRSVGDCAEIYSVSFQVVRRNKHDKHTQNQML